MREILLLEAITTPTELSSLLSCCCQVSDAVECVPPSTESSVGEARKAPLLSGQQRYSCTKCALLNADYRAAGEHHFVR